MIATRSLWRQTAAILWKDVRCEIRTRQVWISMGLFALLVLVVFNFAVDLHVSDIAAVGPGALWIAFVFASVLGLGRTLVGEQQSGSFDRLLVCPVDRRAIYFAKLLGNLLFIGVVELVSIPVFAALFNVTVGAAALIPIVALGTLGIAAIGTLFAAVTANTRAREVLLPVLIFPLIVPVVIGAVKATQALIVPPAVNTPWLGLIAAFDVIFLSISAITFEYVIEE